MNFALMTDEYDAYERHPWDTKTVPLQATTLEAALIEAAEVFGARHAYAPEASHAERFGPLTVYPRNPRVIVNLELPDKVYDGPVNPRQVVRDVKLHQ